MPYATASAVGHSDFDYLMPLMQMRNSKCTNEPMRQHSGEMPRCLETRP